MKIFENFYSFRKYFFWTIFWSKCLFVLSNILLIVKIINTYIVQDKCMLDQLRCPPDHGYVRMAMLLPLVDCQDLLRRTRSYGQVLPTVDTPSARTFYDGHVLMDTTLLNCTEASIKDWIFI